MIYLKIYLTLIFVALTLTTAAILIFMNANYERSHKWYKISMISWLTTLIMIIGFIIVYTWVSFG